MSDLLFYAVLAVLLYYCFFYLPSQKSRPAHLKPTTLNQTTQTEPTHFIPNPETIKQLEREKAELLKDQAQKERTIIGLNNSYEQLDQKFNKLKEELTTLTSEQATEEKYLDQLLKSITKLDQEL
jgi:septal ring factor EnvC (AmiA/AmiB activator)